MDLSTFTPGSALVVVIALAIAPTSWSLWLTLSAIECMFWLTCSATATPR